MAGEETANYELPLVTKNGERLFLLVNATSRRDAAGKVIGVIGIAQDITEVKHREVPRVAGRESVLKMSAVAMTDFCLVSIECT